MPAAGGCKTVLQRLRGHFFGQRIDGHQHKGVGLALEGLYVSQVHRSWFMDSRGTKL